MKSWKLCLLFCLLYSGIQAQSDCTKWYPLKAGSLFEMTSYDKKDKVSSVATSVIKSIEAEDGFTEIEADVTVKDAKGKNMQDRDVEVRCKDGVLYMDLSTQMDPKMMAAYQDVDLRITGTEMEIPDKLSDGQKLPDADCQIEVYSNDMRLMTITYKSSNRKVEGNESVTTPAGTFDCVKISYDMDLKAIVKAKGRVVQYMAPGVGLVKLESFDTKGELTGRTLLTKWKPG